MGNVKWAVVLMVAILSLWVDYCCCGLTKVPKLPETRWGPDGKHSTSIVPVQVQFTREAIDDLKYRLKHTRIPYSSIIGSASNYGMNSEWVKSFVDYWLNSYDFVKREKHLNQFAHFKTNIQGLDIHFIRVKPQDDKGNRRVLPLLMLHGWPGSIVEFYRIIPMLNYPRPEYDFVFEVIAPSLPGFGLSDGTLKPGLGSGQMAVILKNLMLRLKFDKFYVQGGDWGGIIAQDMAIMFPENVIGLHSNFCGSLVDVRSNLKYLLYSFFPSIVVPKEFMHLLYPILDRLLWLLESSGYLHIQATKPDSIGVAFDDSPAGLAAYVLDKFAWATNPENVNKTDGGLSEKFSMDELIDNIMMYWIPKKMTSSMRIYKESLKPEWVDPNFQGQPVRVPTACAQFPNELLYQPEDFLKDRYLDLVRVTRMPSGGHFAALEEPLLLSTDIFNFVRDLEARPKQKE